MYQVLDISQHNKLSKTKKICNDNKISLLSQNNVVLISKQIINQHSSFKKKMILLFHPFIKWFIVMKYFLLFLFNYTFSKTRVEVRRRRGK